MNKHDSAPDSDAPKRNNEEAGFISDRVKRGDYYFLDLDPDPASTLSVACGGREVCDDSYLIERQNFKYYSIEFVASGSGQVTLAGRNHLLGPGSVFCYSPDLPHRIEVDRGTSMVKYFVDFSGSEAGLLVNKAFSIPSPWTVSSKAWIQRLFEDLNLAAQSLTDGRQAVCALLVRQILAMLADRTLSGSHEGMKRTLKFRGLKARLRELALQNYDVADAAGLCGISTSYLSRLFRQFDTETPQRYMVRCRMDFAAALLMDPQLLVKEVAILSGYEDQYHFSRTFKAIHGHSPETFRRLRN